MTGVAGARRLLRVSSLWATVAQVAAKASVLVYAFVATQALPIEDVGLLFSLQGLALLALALTDLGVAGLLTRELSTRSMDASEEEALMSRALYVRILLGLPALALASLLMWRLGVTGIAGGIAVLLILGDAAVLAVIGLLESRLQAEHRFGASAVARSTSRALIAGLSLLVLLPLSRGAALVSLAAIPLVADVFHLWRQSRLLDHSFAMRRTSVQGVVAIIRRALPYAMAGIFVLVYNRLDIAIVAALAGNEEAGIYAPASRLQDALLIAPSVAVAGLAPIAARHDMPVAEVRDLLIRSLRVSVPLAVSGAVAVWVLAAVGALSLLGEEYAASALPVQLTVASVLFTAIGMPLSAVLVARGRVRENTRLLGAALVLALLAHVLLTPRLGAEAAAGIALCREALVAIGAYMIWRRTAGMMSAPTSTASAR